MGNLNLIACNTKPINVLHDHNTGILSLNCEYENIFSVTLKANITGLILSNARINGVYTIYVLNNEKTPKQINHILYGDIEQINKTSYRENIIMELEDICIITIKVIGVIKSNMRYNCISLEHFKSN